MIKNSLIIAAAALTLVGCGKPGHQQCIQGGTVTKIHEAGMRYTVVELDTGQVTAYGGVVSLGQKICINSKWVADEPASK